MQLDYKILFIDDEGFDDYMGSFKDNLENYLKQKGFVLNGIEIKNEIELDRQISMDINYDLIFVDNRFNDKECGIEFIEKIRNAKIYSDIVLCTALSDIDLAKKINAETAYYGFYYIRKGTSLTQYAHELINFRLNKELDINVMRGIAMAEVAKFDTQILDILLLEDKYKSKILEKVKIKAKEKYEDTEKTEEIWRMISNPDTSTLYFDSSSRKDILHANVLKKIDILEKLYLEIRDNYYLEILKNRNKLAHKINPDLSNEEIIKLRKDIIKFREVFAKINKHFKITS